MENSEKNFVPLNLTITRFAPSVLRLIIFLFFFFVSHPIIVYVIIIPFQTPLSSSTSFLPDNCLCLVFFFTSMLLNSPFHGLTLGLMELLSRIFFFLLFQVIDFFLFCFFLLLSQLFNFEKLFYYNYFCQSCAPQS